MARGNWSRYLASLFRLADIENGHSQRFRDTFSASLLQQGVSVETVAMLLGNTPAVVVKHYAPWIKSRTDSARGRRPNDLAVTDRDRRRKRGEVGTA